MIFNRVRHRVQYTGRAATSFSLLCATLLGLISCTDPGPTAGLLTVNSDVHRQPDHAIGGGTADTGPIRVVFDWSLPEDLTSVTEISERPDLPQIPDATIVADSDVQDVSQPHDTVVGVSCTDDVDCQGYRCIDGHCRTSCLTFNHCAVKTHFCNYFSAVCEPYEFCGDDKQCFGAYRCLMDYNVCNIYCITNEQCKEGYSCDLGECVKKPACTSTGTCGAYTCNVEQKVCRFWCYEQSHCVAGYVCDLHEFSCVKPTACSSANDCNGFACFENHCKHGCMNDDDCGSDHYCDLRGTCIKRVKCKNHAPCGGYSCNTGLGLCRGSCFDVVPCAAGHFCQSLVCHKETLCVDNSPCKGHICNLETGRCFVGCLVDAHCDAGHKCNHDDFKCAPI